MIPASGRWSECRTPLRRVELNGENGLILQAECPLCRF
jgi:hypothetical protein